MEDWSEISQESNHSDSPPMSFSSLSGDAENDQKFEQISQNCLKVGDLRSIYEIPHKYRHIFSPYPSFNIVQSKVLDDVYYSDAPVVVSAPTGSGKTVIFEMAIIRLLTKIEELKYTGDFKIVYMAPVKALCTERYNDWQVKFAPHLLQCQELTGDTWETDLSEVGASKLLLTTPEKWDSLTRRWRDKERLVQVVKLFLIDEVHLLNEEQRGPTLEVVVSRMKTIQKTLNFEKKSPYQLSWHIRFIAVSATIPNIEDVSQWLASETIPAKYHKVSDELRPVKLKKIVIGYPCSSSSAFQFDIGLSYKLRTLLMKYAESKPTLIFCSTRKSVEHTSAILAQQVTLGFSPEQQAYLRSTTSTLLEAKLRELVPVGVGYHHAGMDPGDRQEVEQLFRKGLLPILVTTSTLAMGVNLPAHLVIIKSTQQYVMGEYREYSETQVLQMIGRAGRPQFDTTATGVIMTREATKPRYEKLVEGKELVESSLHRHLPEHLNAEVVLKTICELSFAMDWIRSTFLYVRVMKNPKHYGFPCHLEKRGIERKLEEMCLRELHELRNAKLITLNVYDVHPTDTGQLMARYYIAFESMKMFGQICGTENLPQMLKLISKCREFYDIQLRVNEKRTLNALNTSKNKQSIRYPLQGTIKTRDMKVNCLAQAAFSCLSISEISLNQDIMKIMRIGERLMKCLLQLKQVRQHFQSYLSALLLFKCFYRRLWENSLYVARQFDRIGPHLSSLLVAGGKTSFQALAESNPRDLERILNRPPPIGNRIQEMAKSMPKCSLDLQLNKSRPCDELRVNVELLNPQNIPPDQSRLNSHMFCLIVGNSMNSILLHKRISLQELVATVKLSWNVVLQDTAANEVQAHFLSENWIGLDASTKLELRNTKHIQQTISKGLAKYFKQSQQQSSSQSITTKTKSAKTVAKAKNKSIAELIKEKQSTMTPMPHLTLKNQNSKTPAQIKVSQFEYSPQRKSKLLSVKVQNATQKSAQLNTNSILTDSTTKPIGNVASFAETSEINEDTLALQEDVLALQEDVLHSETNISNLTSQSELERMQVTCFQKQLPPAQITKNNVSASPKFSEIQKEDGAFRIPQGEDYYNSVATDHTVEHRDDKSNGSFAVQMDTTLDATYKAVDCNSKAMETECAPHHFETDNTTAPTEADNIWSDWDTHEIQYIMSEDTISQKVSKDCRQDIAVDNTNISAHNTNSNNSNHHHLEDKPFAVVQQHANQSMETKLNISGHTTNAHLSHLNNELANNGNCSSCNNPTQNDTEIPTNVIQAPSLALELSKCNVDIVCYNGTFLNFDLGIDRLLDRNFRIDEDDTDNENGSGKIMKQGVSENKQTVKNQNLKIAMKKIRHTDDIIAQALKDAPSLNSSYSSTFSDKEQNEPAPEVSERVLLQSSSAIPPNHDEQLDMNCEIPGTQSPNTSPYSSALSQLSHDLFITRNKQQKENIRTLIDCCGGSCSNKSNSCDSDVICCNSPSQICSQVEFTSQFSPILKPCNHDDDFGSSTEETAASFTNFSHLWVPQHNSNTVSYLTDYYQVAKRFKKSPK